MQVTSLAWLGEGAKNLVGAQTSEVFIAKQRLQELQSILWILEPYEGWTQDSVKGLDYGPCDSPCIGFVSFWLARYIDWAIAACILEVQVLMRCRQGRDSEALPESLMSVAKHRTRFHKSTHTR